MVSTLKKQLLVLALVVGIVAPASAMESNQDGWFGWKTELGLTALACAGVGYVMYSSWPTTQPKRKNPTAGKPARYYATYTPTPEELSKQAQEDQEHREAQQQHVDVQDESGLLAESEQVVRFGKAATMDQKIEIAAQLDVYVESPQVATQDVIRQYADIYCQRVNSANLNVAVNRLFAAKNEASRKDECKKIKQLLGLIYH